MSNQRYICVIADIVKSRGISDVKRGELQKTLEHCLSNLNRVKTGLVSPYTITLGDEFQVVLSDGNRLFADFWLIQSAVFPIKIRFSIGTGRLNTEINKSQALGMDGPAFHAARAGMDDLKKKGAYLKWTLDEQKHHWVNPTLELISHTSANWKLNRLLLINKMLLGETKVERIAKELGMTKIAVYKNIQFGALKTIVTLFGEISAAVNATIKR